MIKLKKTLQNIKPYEIDKYYEPYSLKLDSNENPYGASPAVIQAIKNFDPDKINHYPAYGELIDKLSSLIESDKNEIILTNGCDEAINVFFNAFLENGDEVLTFAPTFSMPELYSSILGAKFAKIPYEKDFEFSFEKFVKNITEKTQILYLTSPNNPTGTMIKTIDIEKLAKSYPDKLVFLDCTYFNYAELDNFEYFNLPKKYKNVTIAKSFSKDYGIAGLRLGYLYSDSSIINEVKKVISPYSVNSIAVYAGLSAISDIEYFRNVKTNITSSKKLLCEKLEAMGYKPKYTEANFILCDFMENTDFVFNKLKTNGIKVKHFKGIEHLQNTFRITAPKLEDVEYFISKIKARPLFVFDLDGVVFDVQNSYRLTIKKVIEHYTGRIFKDEEIQAAKNLGGLSNDWDLCEFLIKKEGHDVNYKELTDFFQNIFYIKGKGGLIDNEEIVLDENFFKELTKFADCAVFTGRPKEEAMYSLERFNIKKYFSYFICNEDVEGNYKPSPCGLNIIQKKCKYTDIKYFGDTVDDIKAGIDAKVEVYGIIPPKCSNIEDTKKALFNMGAFGIIENKNEILNLAKKDKICR